MKTILLFCLLLLIIQFQIFAQNLSVTSSINLGGNGTDDVNKAIKTSDGNIVLIGSTTSNTGNFVTNHGGKDIFIRKVSLSGSILWTKLYGGSADDTGVDIVEESNGDLTFVANTYSNDGDITVPQSYLRPPGFWICRINFSATTIISQNLDNFSVNFFTESSTAIQAYTKSILGEDITLSRPSSEGFNPSNCRYLHRILLNKNTTFHCFGAWMGEASFKQIISLSNGDYAAIGSISGYTGVNNQPYSSSVNNPNAPNDVFVVRFSNTGGLIWKKYFGGSLDDYGIGIQEINNKLYILGNVNSSDGDLAFNNGGTDIWIAKLDLNGNLIFSSLTGTTGNDNVNSIRKTSNNQLNIVGNKGVDLFYSRVDTTFNITQQYVGNNPNNGSFGKDVLSINSDVYITSDNNSTVGGDIFLLKLTDISTPPSITLDVPSPPSICGNSSFPISFTTTGTFDSGNTFQVLLSDSAGVFPSIPMIVGTGNISPITVIAPNVYPGYNYKMKIIASNPTISSSATSSFSILYSARIKAIGGTAPDPIYQSINICQDSSAKLFVRPIIGSTYQWSKNNVNILGATTSNYTVNSGSGGFYEVEITLSSCSVRGGVGIFQYGVPSVNLIGNNTIVCNGDTLIFYVPSNNSITYQTYQWKKNGIPVLGETGGTYYAKGIGLYTYTVTQGYCGSFTPSGVNITAKPSPIADFTSSIVGQTSTFSNTSTNANYHLWDFGDTSSSTITNPVKSYLSSGTYDITLKSFNSCGDFNSISKSIFIPCTIMYSVLSGNWNANTTWSCNRQPSITDNITISSGHTVTIPSGQTGFVYNLTNNGILLNAGNLKIRIP